MKFEIAPNRHPPLLTCLPKKCASVPASYSIVQERSCESGGGPKGAKEELIAEQERVGKGRPQSAAAQRTLPPRAGSERHRDMLQQRHEYGCDWRKVECGGSERLAGK
jgi:hypothetical protein